LLFPGPAKDSWEVGVKFLLVLAGIACATWYYLKPLPPGVGPNADAGKRAATAVLRSLENFRGDHGMYPETLEELTPQYLSKRPRLANGKPFSYQRVVSNYKLTFNYTNPVPIHCTYEPARKWACEWF
jgi:hypothetical protein